MRKSIRTLAVALPLAAALPLLVAPQASAAEKVCAGGSLMGGRTTTAGVAADQVIHIKVHNHDYRGLALVIRDVTREKQLWKGVIAPGKEHTVRTDVFGEPPIGYEIAFDVTSNLSNNYTYAISSARCY
ncbi:hypothetical protein GCM10017786_62940 [Amycolatopsis deserti]|uniref:Uncharacterized protein n=1 Tax=Amycolatopsis deserti TaxID=185696 RepID=A0ABQ3JDE6_9PSEU|nr:hypothetical protein [Amycolatopsis deserti]GHF20501.1 hypothetical protein GCM10017786_62940 [Amycolatopsis deserti]